MKPVRYTDENGKPMFEDDDKALYWTMVLGDPPEGVDLNATLKRWIELHNTPKERENISLSASEAQRTAASGETGRAFQRESSMDEVTALKERIERLREVIREDACHSFERDRLPCPEDEEIEGLKRHTLQPGDMTD